MQFLYIKDVALLSDRKSLTFLNVIQRLKKLGGKKKYITTTMLKDSLGILCSPHLHPLLHLHAELWDTRKRARQENRTEKQETVNKEFFAFWAHCSIKKIKNGCILHALNVFWNALRCLKNNIKNQRDWFYIPQRDIKSIEILVQTQSEIKNQKST